MLITAIGSVSTRLVARPIARLTTHLIRHLIRHTCLAVACVALAVPRSYVAAAEERALRALAPTSVLRESFVGSTRRSGTRGMIATTRLNDRIAMGVYQAELQLGLSVPQDFSVVSFDDSDLASWLRPQLTSVAIPHFELGRRAVELLLTPDRPNDVIRIPMPLRVRVSVGPPPVRRRRRARTGT